MIRRGLVVALALLIATAAAAVSATRATPGVRVTSLNPVTVAGRAFRAGERVRVVVFVKRANVARVVANRRGRFVARYPFAVGDCTIVRVTARGSKGSTASYAVVPSCAQPRSD